MPHQENRLGAPIPRIRLCLIQLFLCGVLMLPPISLGIVLTVIYDISSTNIELGHFDWLELS